MPSNPTGGNSSGDFRETSGRLHIFHVVTRNSMGLLTPDAFTQSTTPASAATLANKSTTLAGVAKLGVLGGTVCFTRGDFGNNYIGGATATQATVGVRPLGLFINDANGNAYENAPGIASGRGPYVCGSGSCVGTSVYETKNLSTNAALVWGVGDFVYASRNGLLTNVADDANCYESAASGRTLVGVVKIAPDANFSLLVVDLRV